MNNPLFKGAFLHGIALLVLLAGTLAASRCATLTGSFLGLSSHTWLWIAIAVPIFHQIYVWLCWRAELYYKGISSLFGKRTGFRLYAIGFAIQFGSRLLAIIALAISNRETLSFDRTLGIVAGAILLIPSAYLIYSLLRYFGLDRAFGIDHFDAEYRTKPFVKKGIFRFTNNAMYVYGFLILWTPGLFVLSQAALLAALFNHLYIWVHYYCTELPDIRTIYHNKA